jgi:hypothetical protein
MPVCDGCGSVVDEAHIRRRIERLELATRFRPIHIQVLLVDAAPPARVEDYFYRAASDRSTRSLASRMYFDELAKCGGHPSGAAVNEEIVLAEFQRSGFFLTYAVECPLEEVTEAERAVNRRGPTVVQRIQTSYKPKFVAPIGQRIAELIPLFELSGLSDRLVLSCGGPFVDPFLGDPQNQAEFGTALGDRLVTAFSGRLG